MKVVDPNDSTHTITLIPRFETTDPLTLVLYNEVTRVSTTVANTHVIRDGNLTVTYSFTFTDKDKFQVKLDDGTTVVYRGKIIATTQEPQEYKLTDGKYVF